MKLHINVKKEIAYDKVFSSCWNGGGENAGPNC